MGGTCTLGKGQAPPKGTGILTLAYCPSYYYLIVDGGVLDAIPPEDLGRRLGSDHAVRVHAALLSPKTPREWKLAALRGLEAMIGRKAGG